jgi:citrate synthase
MEKDITEFNKRLDKLADYCMNSGQFDQDLYTEYDVKRGLRDSNGKGILTGLTEISDVVAFESVHGRKMPIDGQLYYQGYNIINLIEGHGDDRFGFEEITYLLLFGELPNKAQLDEFLEILGNYRELPDNFVRDIIMNSPNANMMNVLQKSVLTLYSYDPAPEDVSINNVLRQSLQLIARFPLISVYGYHSYRHYILDKSLVIRRPKPELSTAENILRLLRPDGQYTELEAKVLDVALIIHAEHGGGNNSTFTTHVVTSTGTDTYSAIAASLGSLKGPKHGGANLKVQQMFDDIKAHINNWEDEDELSAYLLKILRKEAFDNKGLIYGIGHAVYTESDPRCIILKKYAKALSDEKGLTKEFELYNRIERLAIQLTQQERRLFKPICANVDFYSGFVYTMLGLPTELFTPMFAISRISGWCAHRIEELVNEGKIIRPAYRYVGHHKDYVDIDNRWW